MESWGDGVWQKPSSKLDHNVRALTIKSKEIKLTRYLPRPKPSRHWPRGASRGQSYVDLAEMGRSAGSVVGDRSCVCYESAGWGFVWQGWIQAVLVAQDDPSWQLRHRLCRHCLPNTIRANFLAVFQCLGVGGFGSDTSFAGHSLPHEPTLFAP